jgi:hypothetical protein
LLSKARGMSADPLTRLRHEIDATDTELFRLVRERVLLTRAAYEMPGGEMARVRMEIAAMERASSALGPVTGDAGARRLWALLLELCGGDDGEQG